MLRRVWRGWMKFAHVFGNLQMWVILTLIYWVMILPLAIVFKRLADPLALRHARKPRWIRRSPITDILEYMKKQG